MRVRKLYKYPLAISADLKKPLKDTAASNNISINQLIEIAINSILADQKVIKLIPKNEKIKP
jgi:predicted HicB family RNase H-like nuclease